MAKNLKWYSFMIQLLCSKYGDVIHLVPLTGQICDILEQHFRVVLQQLSEDFTVIAVSVNNHIINRYVDLYYTFFRLVSASYKMNSDFLY